MAEMIALTIDGQALSVPRGTRVIVAAEQLGIFIPRFCYHPMLEVLGACRVCLVRVELPVLDRATGQPQTVPETGEPLYRPMPTLQTSCTLEVSEGMRVFTDTEDVREGRATIIEFLLANHPLDCPICDKGGECLLQEMTMHCGPARQACAEPRVRRDKARPIGGGIVLDQERCIVCFRCTRFQTEWADEQSFGLVDRGNGNEIELPYGRPVEKARFLGNTIELCPVGALTSEAYRFSARPWELADSAGVCPLCPVGCNLTLGGRLGTLCRVTPRQNYQVNDQWICDRARFGLRWVNEGRLTEPQLRPGVALRPAPWAEALDRAAEQLGKARRVAVVLDPSTGCEAGFLAALLARQGLAGAPVHVSDAFDAAGPFSGGVMQLAYSEIVLAVGADLLEEQPILWLRMNRRARQGRLRMVTLAPEGCASDQKRLSWESANLAATRVPAFLSGLRQALREPGHAEALAAETGVRREWLRALLGALAAAKSVAVVVGAAGVEDLARARGALAELAEELRLAKGRAVPHGVLTGGANSRGLRAVGCGSPGAPLGDWREAVRHGEIDGLLLVGGDPFGSADEHVRAAAKHLRACVVVGTNETAALDAATVVLPAASFAETDHCLVSFEGRLQRSAPTNEPIGDTLPDYEILAHLLARLGSEPPGWDAETLRRAIAGSGPGLEAFAGAVPPEGVLLSG